MLESYDHRAIQIIVNCSVIPFSFMILPFFPPSFNYFSTNISAGKTRPIAETLALQYTHHVTTHQDVLPGFSWIGLRDRHECTNDQFQRLQKLFFV
mmetsp:Transcript_28347/g.46074  ORF Transcript_28347/g.46074 Transcript_28347/m.46074 type:complete len:96 (-) Transcript_28347:545-832(-)